MVFVLDGEFGSLPRLNNTRFSVNRANQVIKDFVFSILNKIQYSKIRLFLQS